MRDRRVLVISHMFPTKTNPALGGFVEDLVAVLPLQGQPVFVLTCEFVHISFRRPVRALWALFKMFRRRALRLQESPAGVPHGVFECPAFGLGPGVVSLFYSLFALRVVPKVQQIFPFDVVHAHTSLYDGNAARVLADAVGCRYVITEHTGPFDLLISGPLSRWRTRAALKKAARVLAVSRFLADRMTTEFPWLSKKIGVVPNTLNTSIFKPDGVGRREHGQFFVGWLGHFEPVKQVPMAVEAFQLFHRKFPNSKLLLIGKGELENLIRFQVWNSNLSEHVEFCKAGSKAQVAEYLRGLDALVVSSAVETFSVATIEALACGVPVVATDCGGPRDIITAPEHGSIVDHNPAAIACALEKLASAPNRSTGREARHQYVLCKFAQPVVGQQYIDIYRAVGAKLAKQTVSVRAERGFTKESGLA